jgi:NADH-quinone oxidoreductase subunit M
VDQQNKFLFTADGLSLAMLLLTTSLTAVIIFTSFDVYTNAKAFYALIHGMLWLELSSY